jgi:glycosyltransferase involved in cell wall biosynthesis
VRVLLVQRSLSPPGGGNAVAAWMVHALADQHEVATLTTDTWTASDTNAFYGTAIPERRVTRHIAAAPWRWLSRLPEDRLTRLRMCALLSDARALGARYDLVITADNFAAFARPGIQYVHFPATLQPRPARLATIVNGYFSACERLAGGAWAEAANNLTLVNSRWTAAGLERLGEVPTPIVLHPPVHDPGAGLPWPERQETFLCIGRFHGSKRIETAMAIVAAVRATAMPNARLLIVGTAVDRAYSGRIHGLAARYGNWIEFREDLTRRELDRVMGGARYGIQAMKNEHFGMATAEMTRAGCLVFAHNSGGTPEVLNSEAAVLWNTEEEAVQKIAEASGKQGMQRHLQSLRTYARRFSTENFVARLQELVRGFT